MNLLIVSEFNCPFAVFKDKVENFYIQKAGNCIKKIEISMVHEHKAYTALDCSDFNLLSKYLLSQELIKWGKENKCHDIIYAMAPIKSK